MKTKFIVIFMLAITAGLCCQTEIFCQTFPFSLSLKTQLNFKTTDLTSPKLQQEIAIGTKHTYLKGYFPVYDGDFLKAQDIKAGAKISFKNLNFYAGNVRSSGSVTRLKNFTAKIYSPFKSAVLPKTENTFSLPSVYDNSAPLSFTMDLKTKNAIKNIQFSFTPDNNVFAFAQTDLKFPGSKKITFSTTWGLFKNSPKTDSAWFRKNLYYKEDWYIAGELYAKIFTPYIRSASSFCIIENPFLMPETAFRTWNNFVYKNLIFNTYLALAPENIIMASGTTPSNTFQIILNPQYSFYAKNSIFRAAVDFEQTKTKTSVKTGIGVEKNRFCLIFESDFLFSIQEKTDDFYQKLTFDFKFPFKLNLGIQIQETDDFIYEKISIKAYPEKSFIKSLSLTADAKEKDDSTTGSINAIFSIGARKNFFEWRGNFSILLKFM